MIVVTIFFSVALSPFPRCDLHTERSQLLLGLSRGLGPWGQVLVVCETCRLQSCLTDPSVVPEEKEVAAGEYWTGPEELALVWRVLRDLT